MSWIPKDFSFQNIISGSVDALKGKVMSNLTNAAMKQEAVKKGATDYVQQEAASFWVKLAPLVIIVIVALMVALSRRGR